MPGDTSPLQTQTGNMYTQVFKLLYISFTFYLFFLKVKKQKQNTKMLQGLIIQLNYQLPSIYYRRGKTGSWPEASQQAKLTCDLSLSPLTQISQNTANPSAHDKSTTCQILESAQEHVDGDPFSALPAWLV